MPDRSKASPSEVEVGTGASNDEADKIKSNGHSASTDESQSSFTYANSAILTALFVIVVLVVSLTVQVKDSDESCSLPTPQAAQMCTMPAPVCAMLGWIREPMMSPRAFAGEYTPLKPIGAHTARIPEASDAGDNAAFKIDGQDGDVDFPHGNLKPLFTVGEYDKASGFVVNGVPDGMGAYLKDATTIRAIVQSESYGMIRRETYPFATGTTGASFTGSHVMYFDYDREALSTFMDDGNYKTSAEDMVKGAGNIVFGNVYNLNGHEVEKRTSTTGPHAKPHFTNTDKDGVWSLREAHVPTQADWLVQSLCSAWLCDAGRFPQAGAGVEDTLFLTNEEWISYAPGKDFTGLSAHAIDLERGDMWAVGAFTLGGFEKIVEVNCEIADHVCFSPSGYNGNFGSSIKEESAAKRNAAYGKRGDGTDWVYPQDIVPARLYIGKKGYNEKGERANDFLSRNGLRYGQLYGFAADDTATGSLHRDAWHKEAARATGDTVVGKMLPIAWRWDGTVKNFEHDGSWDFTEKPVGAAGTEKFWTSAGPDSAGKKSEHNDPDPTGKPRFVQSSTAGYFGIYDFADVATEISAAMTAAGGTALSFPAAVACTYINLQGEVDITAQIKLTGTHPITDATQGWVAGAAGAKKGLRADGGDQTKMLDKGGSEHTSFEDIDGIYWVAASDNADGYLIIQEDGGNAYGERSFITKVNTAAPMEYKFIAHSGGKSNSRSGLSQVSVPAGVHWGPNAHEFSGAIDFSALVAKSGGNWVMSPYSGGASGNNGRAAAEAAIAINDKTLGVGLQCHDAGGGVIAEFRGDRAGQLLAYKPRY